MGKQSLQARLQFLDWFREWLSNGQNGHKATRKVYGYKNVATVKSRSNRNLAKLRKFGDKLPDELKIIVEEEAFFCQSCGQKTSPLNLREICEKCIERANEAKI